MASASWLGPSYSQVIYSQCPALPANRPEVDVMKALRSAKNGSLLILK